MEWTDDGIVLGTRRHGESSAIAEVMTRERGRHLGLVRGGSGSRLRPVLQPGNIVRVSWRARLDEHLGNYAVEPLRLLGASLLGDAHAVYALTHVAALCRLLAERDPHPEVHDRLTALVEGLINRSAAAADMVRFELLMLSELGFGLDLETCAATGVSHDLGYVSPRSGRAVSRDAAEPWRDRMFRLPAFLAHDAAQDTHPTADEIVEGFAITGYFLERYVLEPRGVLFADARQGFVIAALGRAPTVAAPR